MYKFTKLPLNKFISFLKRVILDETTKNMPQLN